MIVRARNRLIETTTFASLHDDGCAKKIFTKRVLFLFMITIPRFAIKEDSNPGSDYGELISVEGNWACEMFPWLVEEGLV